MPPELAQWLPVLVMVISILAGLIYNNKRLDDFRDLMRAEIARSESRLRQDIAEFRTELKMDIAQLRTEMAQLRTELKEDIAKVDTRVSRLEVIRSR